MYHRPVTPVEIRGVEFGSPLKTAILVRPRARLRLHVRRRRLWGPRLRERADRGLHAREIRIQTAHSGTTRFRGAGAGHSIAEAAPPSRFTLDVTGCRFVAGGNQGRLLSAYNVTAFPCGTVPSLLRTPNTRKLILTRDCSKVTLPDCGPSEMKDP